MTLRHLAVMLLALAAAPALLAAQAAAGNGQVLFVQLSDTLVALYTRWFDPAAVRSRVGR